MTDGFNFREMPLRRGRRPRAGKAEVVLGAALADAARPGIGDEVELDCVPIGWPRRRILLLILSEGLVLAGIGGLAGAALGWIGHDLLVDSLIPGAELQPEAKAVQALEALGIALLAGLVGALLPAWHASRLSPASALRRQ